MENTEKSIERAEGPRPIHYILYLSIGIMFGIAFAKAEVVSWLRIQEMFRLQSFHMFGLIGTAVTVALITLQLLKRSNIKSLEGKAISIPDKKFNKGQIFGGLMFGIGWAITGACPGPLFGQIGYGATVVVITLLSAILGTWTYGLLKDKLPH